MGQTDAGMSEIHPCLSHPFTCQLTLTGGPDKTIDITYPFGHSPSTAATIPRIPTPIPLISCMAPRSLAPSPIYRPPTASHGSLPLSARLAAPPSGSPSSRGHALLVLHGSTSHHPSSSPSTTRCLKKPSLMPLVLLVLHHSSLGEAIAAFGSPPQSACPAAPSSHPLE